MNIIANAQFQGPSPLRIGDYYQGGLIAYLTGSFPNQSGFVVSQNWVPPVDILQLGYTWSPSSFDIPAASGSAIGTGLINSQYIAAALGNDPQYAAVVALNYTADGYGGWFLPSKDEYAEVCAQFSAGNLDKGYWTSYRSTWTSTQYNATFPWAMDVRNGVINACNGDKSWGKTTRFYVRPCKYINFDINYPYENLQASY